MDNSTRTSVLLIYYHIQQLNRSFVYKINATEMDILRVYMRSMLTCPLKKFKNVKLDYCPYANELNPYVYACCDNTSKFMSMQYFALNLRGYEVTSLLNVLEENV